MINVFVLQLQETDYDPAYLDTLLQFLPVTGRIKIQDRLNHHSKLQTVSGELLARFSIGRYMNDEKAEITLAYGEKGKPHLENLKDVHFNISHSGHYIVCAVSSVEIGIDVERIRTVNLRIADRFFSESEIADLKACDESTRMQYFITLWTIKESYLKAIGRGLTQHLNSFTIIKNENTYQLTGNKHAEGYGIKSYQLSSDFIMAVCAPLPYPETEISYVSLDQITKSLPKYI